MTITFLLTRPGGVLTLPPSMETTCMLGLESDPTSDRRQTRTLSSSTGNTRTLRHTEEISPGTAAPGLVDQTPDREAPVPEAPALEARVRGAPTPAP